MAVQDIRLKADQRQSIENRAAEKREPLVFVPAQAIDERPVKIIQIVDEIPG